MGVFPTRRLQGGVKREAGNICTQHALSATPVPPKPIPAPDISCDAWGDHRLCCHGTNGEAVPDPPPCRRRAGLQRRRPGLHNMTHTAIPNDNGWFSALCARDHREKLPGFLAGIWRGPDRAESTVAS